MHRRSRIAGELGGEMERLLLLAGRAAGLAGLALCVASGILRLAGRFWVGGFQTGTLMQAGVAALVAGCFMMLWVLCLRGETND